MPFKNTNFSVNYETERNIWEFEKKTFGFPLLSVSDLREAFITKTCISSAEISAVFLKQDLK